MIFMEPTDPRPVVAPFKQSQYNAGLNRIRAD